MSIVSVVKIVFAKNIYSMKYLFLIHEQCLIY